MREMKDASTDIIVVSNELFCKEEMAKDFDKHFSRGCNIIEVTSLQPISIMQRIVYALLEKNSFVARDADHIVFTLLSEYSRGAATIVHMLTSLMQKSEDNSRTGFELAKQQLKLHIAHLKFKQFLAGQHTILGTNDSSIDMTPVTHDSSDVSTFSQVPSKVIASEVTSACTDNDPREGDVLDLKMTLPSIFQSNGVHKMQKKPSEDNTPDATLLFPPNTSSSFVSMGIPNESYIIPNIDEEASHRDNDPYSDEAPYKDGPHSDNSDDDHDSVVLIMEPECHNITSSTSKHGSMHEVKSLESTQVHAIGVSDGVDFVAGNDSTQIDSSDPTQLPTTTKPSNENVTAVHQHPLHMYINDILGTNISLLALHLLNSLIITGPIHLPFFYVKALNNVVMNAVSSQEKRKMLAESPMKELEKLGVIRSSSYAMVYHKNLNPDYIDTNIQPMIIPKLICNAVNNQMDDVDKALSVLSVQRALKNLLISESTNLIHLRYILILCNHLDEVCSHVSDHLLTTNLKLKLHILHMLRP